MASQNDEKFFVLVGLDLRNSTSSFRWDVFNTPSLPVWWKYTGCSIWTQVWNFPPCEFLSHIWKWGRFPPSSVLTHTSNSLFIFPTRAISQNNSRFRAIDWSLDTLQFLFSGIGFHFISDYPFFFVFSTPIIIYYFDKNVNWVVKIIRYPQSQIPSHTSLWQSQ